LTQGNNQLTWLVVVLEMASRTIAPLCLIMHGLLIDVVVIVINDKEQADDEYYWGVMSMV
jgi:hypothetical protein